MELNTFIPLYQGASFEARPPYRARAGGLGHVTDAARDQPEGHPTRARFNRVLSTRKKAPSTQRRGLGRRAGPSVASKTPLD
jgi:hypothetical protein